VLFANLNISVSGSRVRSRVEHFACCLRETAYKYVAAACLCCCLSNVVSSGRESGESCGRTMGESCIGLREWNLLARPHHQLPQKLLQLQILPRLLGNCGNVNTAHSDLPKHPYTLASRTLDRRGTCIHLHKYIRAGVYVVRSKNYQEQRWRNDGGPSKGKTITAAQKKGGFVIVKGLRRRSCCRTRKYPKILGTISYAINF